MAECSSCHTVMPHMENLMVQSNRNLAVQYDTICELVDSDSQPSPVSRRKTPPQPEPSNEQACLPKNYPVQYDTICELVDSDSSPSPVLRRKTPPQSESSNEQAWLPDNSECCSVKGDKTPLPKETSVEGGQVLASENVTKTEEKSIAQDESSATKSCKIVVQEVLPIPQVVNFVPHPDNVKNVRKPKDTFVTVEEDHIGNGELHRHVPEVSTEKEDTSDGYNFAKEDNSAKQDQSHYQTLGFPTNIDHCSGENISTDECHKRDRHCCAMPDISRGDLIAITRFRHSYKHFMVYIGDGDVVHRTGGKDEWFSFRKGRIKREKLADIVSDSSMCTLVIENGSWEGHDPLPTDEIIDRAISKIDEKGYNLISKNCEHFARWCRYGQEVSKQVNDLLSQIMLAAVISIPLLAFTCIFYFL